VTCFKILTKKSIKGKIIIKIQLLVIDGIYLSCNTWLQQHRKERETNPTLQNESEKIRKICRLKKELAESKKEIDYLKFKKSN
jgi:hypothetical protein